MKNLGVVSFVTSILMSVIIYSLYHTFNEWLALLSISIIFFILLITLLAYFQKQTEKKLNHHIYQQLKELLPQNYNYSIESTEDINKIIREIYTERKKEQEYFKKMDSYRKEYLGNVSHELKTPLFNIQGYVSTLLDGALNDKEILYEYLKKADKNIERMQNIIDDLETISQLESGAMILDYEPFDLEQLIQEVFEQMELYARNKNIKLKIIKEPDGYYIAYADKFRIRQVFINLISNSIKYGKENGRTIVTIKKENNKIIVSVADDGIGIDEKHLPRIFERFYRVDKGRSREQGGTGLGLAIVKHILEAHKQSIFVKSKLGSGTVFTFTLESK